MLVVPSEGSDAYVELAETKTGRLFRKMILPMNQSFVHPKLKDRSVHVDQAFAEKLVANFKAGICDTVQFPLVDDANRHVEDPLRNMGRVVDVEYDDSGVYAVLDVRKHAEDIGETILGASAMLHLDYENTATGEKVGPTLLHVAGTNRPYLTNLAPYESVVLSMSDTDSNEAADELLMLTATQEAEKAMTKEEMIAALLEEHGIDVQALQNRDRELVASLSSALEPAVEADLIELSGGEDLSVEALVSRAGAVAQKVSEVQEANVILETENLELSTSVEEFQQTAAEAEIDGYVSSGRILPVQRDAMLELRLTDAEMFERLLPSVSLVELSERGVTTHDSSVTSGMEDAEDEVSRLSDKMTTNG